MDTNKIKRFACDARNKLKEGIAAKIITLGFDKNGNVKDGMFPQLMQGGCLWNGQLQTEGFYHQWMSLYNRIQQKGINEVYEEAAYTWFNRLCAIRILQKNNLCSPVLVYADEARTPVIVDEARQGRFPQMKEEMRQRLIDLLEDDTKVMEQFAVLITAWCHANPIINSCFGGIADYTELLLPNNILAEGGFVDMLNHTEFITYDDYKSPELIGWLYQFYISERKDEVFAKKGKFEADEIPAATQIFTPNWIVKYMVQNTIGRIYLDNHPEAISVFKPKWKYLVDQADNDKQNICKFEELTDLVCGDLACGSGHIENEMFDILFDLYMYEGYSRSEAIENIFRCNLVGIDLDSRAKQLATFALMLKACQKDESFTDARCMPNILTMPKVHRDYYRDTIGHFGAAYRIDFNGTDFGELYDAFILLEDADSLGSIMKFNLSAPTLDYICKAVDAYNDEPKYEDSFTPLIDAFKLIIALTQKYHVLVMNPPYMGSGNMNAVLSKYVKENYPRSKADLMSVFMDVDIDRLVHCGKYGMINMHSWMFLSSFEELRRNLLDNQTIDSLLHLGPRTFDELSGEVVQNASFVISNCKTEDAKGTFFRLVDGKNCSEKEKIYLSKQNIYTNVEQSNFYNIPTNIFGYWVSNHLTHLFEHLRIKDFVQTSQGMKTLDNDRFIRDWWEIGRSRFSFNNSQKWAPVNSGGEFRKWFGDNYFCINWENNGQEIKELAVKKYNSVTRTVTGMGHYFKPGITWNAISSDSISVRKFDSGFLFTNAGMCAFGNEENLYLIQGVLNSKVGACILEILSPTLNYGPNQIKEIPLLNETDKDIVDIVKSNIDISKQDWDAHESSWDFQRNPLCEIAATAGHTTYKLGALMNLFEVDQEENFRQLHHNEEELNRQFIEIYGLREELTPDVAPEDITILQQGEISFEDGTGVKEEDPYLVIHNRKLVWHYDVLMKQLISYAIGCMMGRYSIYKPGLILASQGETIEHYNNRITECLSDKAIINSSPSRRLGGAYNFEIDDDAIIPLMPNNCGFADNASQRFSDFVRQVFGEDNHVENLNYVEQCLGKTVEQYFVKDFWKDHKKMYQNRPIYWLFSSKKGAFQVITYMHRMNAYTVERIRAKYLLPFIEHLQSEINNLDMRRAELTTKETKQLQNLKKQLDECREYHERLQVVAEKAIAFDLDDGVVVNYAKFGDVVQKIK